MTAYIQQLLFQPNNLPLNNIIDNISNLIINNVLER